MKCKIPVGWWGFMRLGVGVWYDSDYEVFQKKMNLLKCEATWRNNIQKHCCSYKASPYVIWYSRPMLFIVLTHIVLSCPTQSNIVHISLLYYVLWLSHRDIHYIGHNLQTGCSISEYYSCCRNLNILYKEFLVSESKYPAFLS